MGAGASSLPEFLNQDECKFAAGDFFTDELWAANQKEDKLSRDDFIRLGTVKAVCNIAPKGNPETGAEPEGTVSGVVNFEQLFGAPPCKITYEIKGLTPGLHGLHIHELSDFSEGLASVGPHFNPHGKVHGGPEDEERHIGDLGNIEANAEGVATGEISSTLIMLSGEYSVVGRPMVVHADPDDLGKGDNEHTATTGNAGAALAGGEIVKTEALQQKVQASAMRQKFASQSSSFLSRSRISVSPDETDEDPFGGGDAFENDLEPLGEEPEGGEAEASA